jgi:hypothetical protein
VSCPIRTGRPATPETPAITLVCTQVGRTILVLISPEEFDRLTYEAHVVAAIEQGLADGEAGRVVDDEELGRVLASKIGDLAG